MRADVALQVVQIANRLQDSLAAEHLAKEVRKS